MRAIKIAFRFAECPICRRQRAIVAANGENESHPAQVGRVSFVLACGHGTAVPS